MIKMLFSPYKFGRIILKNRIVMSPMTRNRSPQNIPDDNVALYYTQRSEAGLIITEGTSPSPNGLGYARIPGLFNQEQVEGFKKVTHDVHEAGGKIFVQLMHTGRVSHPDNMPQGTKILAPSAVKLSGQMWTDTKGLQTYPIPNEMTEKEIQDTIDEYVKSSELAIKAGFDGVEIHGANGYLVDQFLNTGTNKRTDIWGGSIENRIRFAVTVAREISEKISPDRVGMRVSPYGVFNDMEIDPTIEDTFEQLAIELNKIGIIHMHIVDHSSMGSPEVKPTIKQKIRDSFTRTLILSGGYDRERAEVDLVEKMADLIAFGRPFIANPRLVTKLKLGSILTTPDANTFYTPGEKGYIDYPI